MQATFFMSVLITTCCLAYQAPVGEEHFREHSREGHVFEILMCVRHTPIDSTYAFIYSFTLIVRSSHDCPKTYLLFKC